FVIMTVVSTGSCRSSSASLGKTLLTQTVYPTSIAPSVATTTLASSLANHSAKTSWLSSVYINVSIAVRSIAGGHASGNVRAANVTSSCMSVSFALRMETLIAVHSKPHSTDLDGLLGSHDGGAIAQSLLDISHT